MSSIILLLALAVEPFSPSAILESPTRHVRSTDRYTQRVLRSGFQRSPTFARLLVRLERSDLMVYIEPQELSPAVEGQLVLMGSAHGRRYVLIEIGVQLTPNDAIALLGHELQHANEVADAPEVIDMKSFAAFYQRVGRQNNQHQFETKMAVEAGDQVRRELS